MEIHLDDLDQQVLLPDLAALLREWQEAARDGLPAFALFAPEERGVLGQFASVIRCEGQTVPVCLQYGAGLVNAYGMDFTGQPLPLDTGRTIASIAKAAVQCYQARQPVLATHRFDERAAALAGQMPLANQWQRLFLPCRHPDGDVVIVCFRQNHDGEKELLTAIFHTSQDSILAVRFLRDDPTSEPYDGQIVAANRRAGQLTGYTREQLTDGLIRELFPAMRDETLWSHLASITKDDDMRRFEVQMDVHGQQHWVTFRVSAITDGFVVAFHTINGRKKQQEEQERYARELQALNAELSDQIARAKALEHDLKIQALVDPLTGLANRRSLSTKIGECLAAAERFGQPLCVVICDIDHFKRINDSRGHAAGDKVLTVAAKLLRHGIREQVDTAGRLGGEEFLLILPNATLEGAVTLATRLRDQMEKTVVLTGDTRALRFTASFGIAEWNGRESADRLISRADHALYKAKSAGRNMVCVASGESETVTIRRFTERKADAPPVKVPPDAAPPLSPDGSEAPIGRKSGAKPANSTKPKTADQ